MEKLQPIPYGYEESIDSVLYIFDGLNQPRFKGYIKITARPAGSRTVISEELYCMDKDASSHQRIFEAFCGLLQKARNSFGKKDFLFEILNRRNDSLLNTRVNISRRIFEAVELTQQPPATGIEDHLLVQFEVPANTMVPITPQEIVPEPAVVFAKQHKQPARRSPRKPRIERAPDPYPEPVPIQVPTPDPAPVPDSADAAPPSSNGEPEFRPCPNPDAEIDYKSMYYFPTEQAPRTIRKAFGVCGIRTNGDILRRLGTVEPTRQEWEIFIRELRKEAAKGGAKFWDSCDGHLYWWLSKKMCWIHPFPKKT